MSKCYICSRDAKTRCTSCYKDICNAHAEDEKITNGEISAICTPCIKKRKLKRIRLYTIIVFIVMAVAIVLGVVFTSQTLW
ncbi:MAG: hypothetical protein FK733_01015 [Asgard group archaeon]|nr:hypothetical protein [Asgard group archaeon]